MKIYYFVKNIDRVPSCQYNILMLSDLGYEVTPVFGRSTKEIQDKLLDNGIKTIVLDDDNIYSRSVLFFQYRKLVKKILKTDVSSDDLIFVGTGDTAICMNGLYRKYPTVLCIKELYDHATLHRKILIRLCRQATTVVACEINRARYMKAEWGLKELPYVIPNKPYTDPLPKGNPGTTELTQRIIRSFTNQKPIIYQANHIHYAKELTNLATALRNVGKEFVLVLVGNIDDPNDVKQIQAIYPNVICSGYVKSPLHMEITSNAYIGITVYQDNSLNNLFCAPNKIYEYSCFGIPTLANDVPGLIETVGISRSGICVNWNSVDEIEKALTDISLQYAEYEALSIAFFKSVDCKKIIKDIVIQSKQKYGE